MPIQQKFYSKIKYIKDYKNKERVSLKNSVQDIQNTHDIYKNILDIQEAQNIDKTDFDKGFNNFAKKVTEI